MVAINPSGVDVWPSRNLRGRLRLLREPAALLVLLTSIFGVALVLINPPLRGPDEQAHFVRVYAYAHGVILPGGEVDGRKGIYLPASLHADYAFFDAQRHNVWNEGFSFRTVYEEYRKRHTRPSTKTNERVFVPYEGTEGYTLVAYAPYVLASLAARGLGLDFAATIMLMRMAGLAAFTAIAAYAVAMTPQLKWAFFAIAMLPAALYGRAVVSADGAAVSFTLVAVALALRVALGRGPDRPGQRAIWMTLCALSKPPQVAFLLLEPMIARWRNLPGRWRVLVMVMAPGLALTLVWIWAVGAEMAAWRLGDYPQQQFTFAWKLGFMAEHPLHFPAVLWTTFTEEAFGLWRQLIGVFGWLDTFLHTWTYTAITALLALTAFEHLNAEKAVRRRLAIYGAIIVAAYTIGVSLILFITWTPPDQPVIWGIQGRYFIGVLPLIALMIAALCPLTLPAPLRAGAAIAGAVISGIATTEALWRVNWAG